MSDSFITLPDGTKLRGFTGTVAGNVVSWEAQSFVDPATGNTLRIATTGGAYRLGVESLLRSGAKGTSVEADVTSTAIDADHQGLDVVVHGAIVTTGLTDAQLRASPVPVTTGGLTDTQLRATAVPVSGPLTDAQLRAAPVPVSGTVSTGGLTDAQLRATPVPVSGPLTDTQLRATPVPVSGTVTTGGLTDTQLRATPVPVSGTVTTGGLTDTQLRATPVPVSGPLTDTQLRATPVPISGTVTATGPLTDTQLRASAVPVDVSDRAGRLLGIIASITAAVDVSDRVGRLLGVVKSITDPVVVASITAAVDVSDRAGRLVGIVSAVALDVALSTRAADATLTNGTAKSVVRGGAKGATIAADVTSTPIGADHQALDVAIVPVPGAFNNGAETAVGAAAVQVIAADATLTRKAVILQNTGTANVRVGKVGVTTTSGIRLVPNGSVTIAAPISPFEAFYAIREGTDSSIVAALEIT